MKSPHAKAVLEVAQSLSPATTLDMARQTFPALQERDPGVWGCRLIGSSFEDAIDLRLTFDDKLNVIWIRGTIWNAAEADKALLELRRHQSANLGRADRRRAGRAPEIDQWHSPHETVKVESRESEEDGFYLGQVILTRTFVQPAAAQAAFGTLNLLVGEAPQTPVLDLPSRRAKHAPKAEEATYPKHGKPVRHGKELNWPRLPVDGPFLPKWKTGRQRIAPATMYVDGPLFMRTEIGHDGGDVERQLQALDHALEGLSARSDWAPMRQANGFDLRHHSDRWWHLGGGVMLHVYVREWSLFEPATSKIIIDAYEELDGPPDQSARRTPTLKEVIAFVSAATAQALGSLPPSPP